MNTLQKKLKLEEIVSLSKKIENWKQLKDEYSEPSGPDSFDIISTTDSSVEHSYVGEFNKIKIILIKKEGTTFGYTSNNVEYVSYFLGIKYKGIVTGEFFNQKRIKFLYNFVEKKVKNREIEKYKNKLNKGLDIIRKNI